MKEYHNGKLTEDKKTAFLEKFREDTKYRESVVEQIMILNERFLNVEKSKILANLFQAHVNGKYVWEVFCDLAACLDALHLRGILLLEESAKKEGQEQFHIKTDLNRPDEGLLATAGVIITWGNHYYINAYGQNLYYYGIKGDLEFTFPK